MPWGPPFRALRGPIRPAAVQKLLGQVCKAPAEGQPSSRPPALARSQPPSLTACTLCTSSLASPQTAFSTSKMRRNLLLAALLLGAAAAAVGQEVSRHASSRAAEASASWLASAAGTAACLPVHAACRMTESCCGRAPTLLPHACRHRAEAAARLAPLPPHQIVLNRGSAGCAQLPPGPPENLRAKAGDGEVTLTWDRPRNGELNLTLHQQLQL